MLVTFEVVFFEVQLEPDLSSKSCVCRRTNVRTNALAVPQASAEGISLWSHVC